MSTLTQNQIDTFHQDGYLAVQNVVQADALTPFINMVNGAVAQRAQAFWADGKIANLHADQPFETRWNSVFRQVDAEQGEFGWHTIVFSPQLFSLITHPNILDVVGSLVGDEIQFNGDFWVRPKLPSEKITTLPWHQDSAYMPKTESEFMLTVWMPLVDVNEQNGTLQFIPGSHCWGLQDMQRIDGERFTVPVQDPATRAARIETLEMKTGDLVIFHNLTFHRSLNNQSDHIRWSTDFRYSATGTPLDELWHENLAFVARSIREPQCVESWAGWQAKWDASEHKERRL